MSPEYLASILEIIIAFDFLCDIGCGHPVPVTVFSCSCNHQTGFTNAWILFAHDHHSFRV